MVKVITKLAVSVDFILTVLPALWRLYAKNKGAAIIAIAINGKSKI